MKKTKQKTGVGRPLQLSDIRPGDIVDVVSPGSASKREDVERALQVIQSWGLTPRLPQDSFAEHPFHSNFDSERLRHLKNALQAKDSSFIWCIRGGYGANRLLLDLAKLKKPIKKKLLLGYSDITSLHLFLNQNWKWPSWHAPTIESLITNKLPQDQIKELKDLIFGERKTLEFRVQPINPQAKKKLSLKGELTGGNLTVLASTIGSAVALRAAGKILVLEDIGERGYRIDRHLYQLRISGALKSCRAVVFGDFINGAEPDGKDFSDFAIDRFSSEVNIPCFRGLPMGHANQNRVVPLGVQAKIKDNIIQVGTGLE